MSSNVIFMCFSAPNSMYTEGTYLLSNLVAILPLAYLILPHLAEEPLIIL